MQEEVLTRKLKKKDQFQSFLLRTIRMTLGDYCLIFRIFGPKRVFWIKNLSSRA